MHRVTHAAERPRRQIAPAGRLRAVAARHQRPRPGALVARQSSDLGQSIAGAVAHEPADRALRRLAAALLHAIAEYEEALGRPRHEGLADHADVGALLEPAPTRPTIGARSSDAFAEPRASLCREGDYWTVAYQDALARLKDMKGLHYLAHLLRHPAQEFHVLELIRQAPGATSSDPEVGYLFVEDCAPLLDAHAKTAYRHRLVELRSVLAEAERDHNVREAEGARQEIDALTEHLAAAVGLGGRDRTTRSAVERARVALTQRLRAAIARIAQRHRALGDHLETRVRTGTFCVYQPDPVRPLAWDLEADDDCPD